MPDINRSYSWAINTCNADNVGYSQSYRNQKTVNGITYYDCSSFIWYALKAGNFDGYWKSYYTASGDGTVLSSAIKEDTELYIEGTKLAVNGSLFGLAMYDCTVENGVLTFVTDKGIVTLQLLRDNYLKLTLSGDAPTTLYLSARPIPGITPEVEAL